ncbi:hypothetical protein HZB60_06435 [candidate division KSB1 bacterium]|nr:hypothetical protein [candidate division KSB1 bacterium]
MLRKWLCAALGLFLVGHLYAADTDRKEFGAGIVLGEPSGLNGQWYWSNRSAVDVTIAWSWHDWFFTAADYQVYDYVLDAPREWRWYYGGGAYLTLPKNEDGTIGLRLPLGLKYHWPHSAIDTWVEVAPALQLAPDTQAELQGGLGFTFWLR